MRIYLGEGSRMTASLAIQPTLIYEQKDADGTYLVTIHGKDMEMVTLDGTVDEYRGLVKGLTEALEKMGADE